MPDDVIVINPPDNPTESMDKIKIGNITYSFTGGGGAGALVAGDGVTITGSATKTIAVTNPFTDADETKLDGIASGAEVNVQADWNASSGDAEILNKPTIPAAQVQSDWAETDTTAVDFIKNKPNPVDAPDYSQSNLFEGVKDIIKGTDGTTVAVDDTAETLTLSSRAFDLYDDVDTEVTTVANDDRMLVSDTSLGSRPNRYVTVDNFKKSTGFVLGTDVNTRLQTLSDSDLVLVADVSESGNPNRYMTVQSFKEDLGVSDFDLHDDVTTALTTVADDDRMLISDESASGDPNKYVTISTLKTTFGSGGGGGGSNFDLHDNVATALTSPADDDRLLISDESESGDPNKYVTVSTLKSTFGSGDFHLHDDVTTAISTIADDDRVLISDESETNDPNRYATISSLKTLFGGSSFDLHDDVTTGLTTVADDDRMLLSDESAAGDPNKYATISTLKSVFGGGGGGSSVSYSLGNDNIGEAAVDTSLIGNEFDTDSFRDISPFSYADDDLLLVTASAAAAVKPKGYAVCRFGDLIEGKNIYDTQPLYLKKDGTSLQGRSDALLAGNITVRTYKINNLVLSASNTNVSDTMADISATTYEDNDILLVVLSSTNKDDEYFGSVVFKFADISDTTDVSWIYGGDRLLLRRSGSKLQASRFTSVTGTVTARVYKLTSMPTPSSNTSITPSSWNAYVNVSTDTYEDDDILLITCVSSSTSDEPNGSVIGRFGDFNGGQWIRNYGGSVEIQKSGSNLQAKTSRSPNGTLTIRVYKLSQTGGGDTVYVGGGLDVTGFGRAKTLSAAGGFAVHDVSTELTSLANDDRFVVSDESATGDPNKYITAANLKFKFTRDASPQLSATDVADSDRMLIGDASVSGTPNKYATISNLKTVFGSGFDLHDDVTTELTSVADDDRMLISDESATGDPNKYVAVSTLKSAFGGGIANNSTKATKLNQEDRMLLADTSELNSPDKYFTFQQLYEFFQDPDNFIEGKYLGQAVARPRIANKLLTSDTDNNLTEVTFASGDYVMISNRSTSSTLVDGSGTVIYPFSSFPVASGTASAPFFQGDLSNARFLIGRTATTIRVYPEYPDGQIYMSLWKITGLPTPATNTDIGTTYEDVSTTTYQNDDVLLVMVFNSGTAAEPRGSGIFKFGDFAGGRYFGYFPGKKAVYFNKSSNKLQAKKDSGITGTTSVNVFKLTDMPTPVENTNVGSIYEDVSATTYAQDDILLITAVSSDTSSVEPVGSYISRFGDLPLTNEFLFYNIGEGEDIRLKISSTGKLQARSTAAEGTITVRVYTLPDKAPKVDTFDLYDDVSTSVAPASTDRFVFADTSDTGNPNKYCTLAQLKTALDALP